MPPKIDIEKCTGCGSCVDVCPNEVFELVDDKSSVSHSDECMDCECCATECPMEAIMMLEA